VLYLLISTGRLAEWLPELIVFIFYSPSLGDLRLLARSTLRFIESGAAFTIQILEYTAFLFFQAFSTVITHRI
jgi:hypothetical protein